LLFAVVAGRLVAPPSWSLSSSWWLAFERRGPRAGWQQASKSACAFCADEARLYFGGWPDRRKELEPSDHAFWWIHVSLLPLSSKPMFDNKNKKSNDSIITEGWYDLTESMRGRDRGDGCGSAFRFLLFFAPN
jgi:hypothetical protein